MPRPFCNETKLARSGEASSTEESCSTVCDPDFSEAIVESLPRLFFVLGPEGNFLRWNRKVEIVTGCSSQRLAEITF